MDSPLVSILIPVYNRENLIEETVRSALCQTYKNIEIIVVDNKSSDDTWGILTSLANLDDRIKIFQNDKNIGAVRNWQRCINEAQGIYGKILWSDDLISPEFVEKTLPYLELNNRVGFVFTGTEIFYEDDTKNIEVYFIGESGLYNCDLYVENVLFDKTYPVSPGCALFRLSDLKKNLLVNIPNKMNSDFSTHAIGNDLLIFLLTANDYKEFAFVNEKLSFFRAHSGSISIATNPLEMQLFYTLVGAFFIEHYSYRHKVQEMNEKIYNFLNQYDTSQHGVIDISDFYLINKNFELKENKTSKLIGFSKNYNIIFNQIMELKSTSIGYVIYGNGTISKTVQALIPEKVIGYVDMSDEEHHPKNLKNLKYDKIIISVLGREDEIIEYLTQVLSVRADQIVTFTL